MPKGVSLPLAAAAISASITLIGILIAYTQWRRDFRSKLDDIHDEVTKELVRQRIEPYVDFMRQIEVLSRRHELALKSDRARVRDLSQVFHKAIYGHVGVLASNLTREILVSARAGCITYADRKITFDELMGRIWGIHQGLRSDLGLNQPNWPNETEARRAGLLASEPDAIEERLRTAVHLTFDLYGRFTQELRLEGGRRWTIRKRGLRLKCGGRRRTCQAIIFDMDGLLLDSEVVERRAWQRAAVDRSCSITDEEFGLLVGRTSSDTEEILRGLWRTKKEDPDQYEAIHTLKEQYASQERIDPKLGAVETLDWARHVGIPVAVASSSRRTKVIERLTRSGLLDLGIEIIVGGEEVAKGKPSPDIFELAAKSLNVAAEACVVLEDSPSGIAAAYAARMTTILISDASVVTAPPSSETLGKTYMTYSSLLEFHGVASRHCVVSAKKKSAPAKRRR